MARAAREGYNLELYFRARDNNKNTNDLFITKQLTRCSLVFLVLYLFATKCASLQYDKVNHASARTAPFSQPGASQMLSECWTSYRPLLLPEYEWYSCQLGKSSGPDSSASLRDSSPRMLCAWGMSVQMEDRIGVRRSSAYIPL